MEIIFRTRSQWDGRERESLIRRILSPLRKGKAGDRTGKWQEEREADYQRLKRMEADYQRLKRMEEDHRRLREMERRIKVYPDLYKAVRAAVEHEDGIIDPCLQRHVRCAQESQRRSP